MLRGVQLAQHLRQNRDIGQLLEGNALQTVETIDIGDTSRGNKMAHASEGRVSLEFINRLGGSLVDIGYRQPWKRRLRLGRIGGFLHFAQKLLFRHDALAIGGQQLAVQRGERLQRFVRLVGLGLHHNRSHVLAFAEQRPEELLEVSLFELFA